MQRVLALVGLLVAFSLSGCFDSCSNKVIREVPSPDGNLKAFVFDRNCGATTGFSTQVSVLPAGSGPPSDGGNIFVADTDHGAAPSGPSGGPDVSVKWLSPTSLKIVYDQRARTFNKQALCQGVSVTYQTN